MLVCVSGERTGTSERGEMRKGGGKEDKDTGFLLLTCHFTDQVLFYERVLVVFVMKYCYLLCKNVFFPSVHSLLTISSSSSLIP